MVLAFVGDSTMISGFATTVSSGYGSLEASFGPQYKPGRQARPIPSRGARGTAAPGQELHETRNVCILRLTNVSAFCRRILVRNNSARADEEVEWTRKQRTAHQPQHQPLHRRSAAADAARAPAARKQPLRNRPTAARRLLRRPAVVRRLPRRPAVARRLPRRPAVARRRLPRRPVVARRRPRAGVRKPPVVARRKPRAGVRKPPAVARKRPAVARRKPAVARKRPDIRR